MPPVIPTEPTLTAGSWRERNRRQTGNGLQSTGAADVYTNSPVSTKGTQSAAPRAPGDSIHGAPPTDITGPGHSAGHGRHWEWSNQHQTWASAEDPAGVPFDIEEYLKAQQVWRKPGPFNDSLITDDLGRVTASFDDNFLKNMLRAEGLLDKSSGIPGLRFDSGFRTGMDQAQDVIGGFNALTDTGGALESLKEGSFDAGAELDRLSQVLAARQVEAGTLAETVGGVTVPNFLTQGTAQLDQLMQDIAMRGNFGLDILGVDKGGTAQLDELRRLVEQVKPSFLEAGQADLKTLGGDVGDLETKIGKLGDFADLKGIDTDISALGRRIRGLGASPAGFQLPGGVDDQIGELETKVRGLGGLADFKGISGEIGDLQGLVGALGGLPTGLDEGPDSIANLIASLGAQVEGLGGLTTGLPGIDDQIGELETRIGGLGGTALPAGLERIRGMIGGAQRGIAGLGTDQTPDFTGIDTDIDKLATRIGGLGGTALPAGLERIRGMIGGAQRGIAGLGGGDTPEGLLEIMSLIENAQGDIGGLGTLPGAALPAGLQGILDKIGVAQEDIGGLGGLADFKGIGGEIAGLQGLVRGLGGLPTGLPGIGEEIGGLERRVGDLSRRPTGLGDIGQRIGGFEDRIGDLGRRPTGLEHVEQRIDRFRNRVEGLGGLGTGLGGIGTEIDELATRIGGLGGDVTPEGIQSILDLIGTAQENISGLGTFDGDAFPTGLQGILDKIGVAQEDIRGLGALADFDDISSEITGLKGRVSALGRTPAGLGGIRTEIDELATKIGGLGGDLPAGLGGIGTEIDELATKIGGLGGDLPAGLGDIGTEIGGLESRMDRLGDVSPDFLQDVLGRISGAEGRIAGLGTGEFKPDFEDILKQIGYFQSNISGLGGLEAGLGPEGPLGGMVKGLEDRVRALGGQTTGLGSGFDDFFSQADALNARLDETSVGFQQAVDDLIAQFSGYVGTGDGGQGGGGIDPDPRPITQTDSGSFINQLEGILRELADADPFNVEQLRADPVTAALLSDLTKETGQEEARRIEQLQRFGALGSGSAIDQLVDLSEGATRAEFDILGRGAERARADRDIGLDRGIDLAGLASGRELSIAEMMGMFGDKKTMGGRQADLDIIASVLASLDPELSLNKGVNISALANAILGTSGFSDEDKALFIDAFGTAPAPPLGEYEGDGSDIPGEGGSVSIDADGEVVGTLGNPDMDAALDVFLEEHPDLASGATGGQIGVVAGDLWKGTRKIATWDSWNKRWVRR